MSLVIKFYFTFSMLNMFRTLIGPSSGACDFSVLQPATQIPPQPSHTETPTHIETRTHDRCGDSIEKSQAPDDGCINVRNMLLQPATRIPPQPSHTETPTHIETRTHHQCGDSIEMS